MSYAVKYRAEWTDILGMDWKVDIEEDAYGGSINTMQSSESPLTIEFLSNSDDVFDDPIKGSKATIRIWADTNFQYLDLYAVQDQQFRVSIYYSSTLYWQGFIFSGDYSEPYDTPPYEVEIQASDQLGILKDITYDNAGVYYNGRIRESKIILDILAKIGLTGFTEYVNLYEAGMADDTTDSPFDQIALDADLFQDMTCYAVLGEILRKYNAIIRNIEGEMIIYRPVELSSDTVYGRVFTGETTKTGTSTSPEQLLKRTGVSSNLEDRNGGRLLIKSPAKKVTIDQDCGNKDSWIDNFQLQNSTFSGSVLAGWTVSGWTNIGGADPVPVSRGIPGESSGMILNGHNAYPTISKYMSATFGVNTVVSSDIFVIEFDYLMYNNSLTDRNAQHIYVYVISDNASKYLKGKDEEYCEWSDTEDKIDITIDAVQGTAGWQHFSRKIVGVPTAGSYSIRLCACSNTYLDVFAGYKNIQFYTLSTLTSIVRVPIYKSRGAWWNLFVDPIRYLTFNTTQAGKQVGFKKIFKYTTNPEISVLKYEKTNAINGHEFNFNYILGDIRSADVDIDNRIEQFAGSLALATSAGETLAQAASRFILDHGTAFSDVIGDAVGTNLFYTGPTDGDFASSLTFTNTSGDLAGSISTIQSYSAAMNQITSVGLSGTSGSIDITCDGITETMSFYGATIQDTIDQFIIDYATSYSSFTLTRDGNNLEFEGTGGSGGFTFNVYVSNEAGITGSTNVIQDASAPIARIDRITLSGSTGTANVIYGGVTVVMDFATSYSLSLTASWHTRGGSENKPLLHLICDEIANRMSRPGHFITGLPVSELVNSSFFSVIGRVEDSLNQVSGNNRKFVFNRGTYEAREREWSMDLVEIL